MQTRAIESQAEKGRKDWNNLRVPIELNTTVSALALAWVTKIPNSSTVILGASSPERLSRSSRTSRRLESVRMPTSPPELCLGLELMGLVSIHSFESHKSLSNLTTRVIYALKIFGGVCTYVKSTDIFFNLKNDMGTWYRLQYILKFIIFSPCCLLRIFKY